MKALIEGSPDWFEQTIAVVHRQQTDLKVLHDSISCLTASLEQQLEKTVVAQLKKRFSTLYILASYSGETVWVYGPNSEEIARQGKKVLGWYKGLRKVDVGVNPEDVIAECKRLSKEFHVEVAPVYCREDPTTTAPSNIDDLQAVYGEAAVVASGEVWHKGWDIPDIFAIVKLDNTFKLYLSTSGHSSSFSEVIEAKDGRVGLDKFFDFIEQDEDHAALRVEWYRRIADAWWGV